jgi:hypothetical protein
MHDSRCDLLHQILNELTIVQGECELIEDGKRVKASRGLKVIRASVRRMTNLILNHSCPVTREVTAGDCDSHWLFNEAQGPNEPF